MDPRTELPPIEPCFPDDSAHDIYAKTIDFEFPMLTDEDVDSIVQNIGDAEDTKQDPIAKQLPIDEFQKHVEESLLFLDHEKYTNEENKNNAISSQQLGKMTTTASDDHNKMVELDKNEIMQDLHDSLTYVQLVQSIQEKNPISDYKDDNICKGPHEKSNSSVSKMYAGEQEAIAKNADQPNREETKPVHEDKSFAENIEEFFKCENTKITGDITPNVEEIPEKINKNLVTVLIKTLVENDAKNENDFKNPCPSEEIVQEISVATVNQIESSENEKLDHMKVDSVNNVEVGNCQEKASDFEESDKIKENSNVAQEDNSSLDKLDAVKVSETCNILEKVDNNEISSVQKNKPLHNNAQDETGMVLAELSHRSMDDVSQTFNVYEKNSIDIGDNCQKSTHTVEEHDNLFEHKLLVSIKRESELMASEDLSKENAEEPQTTIKTEKDDHGEESSLVVENTTSEHDKKVTVKIENDSDTLIQSVEEQLAWKIIPRDCESLKREVLESEDNPAHESLIKEDKVMHDTSNQADKTLVWEIKSIISEPPLKEVPGNKERLLQHSLMKEALQDTGVDKQYSQNAAEQINESVSVAHVEMESEEKTECLPAKRAKVESIWTTNVINEDQPNVSQQNIKTVHIKTLVENDAKNENDFKNPIDPVPSEEIVQEILVATVNQIELPENEKLDHMKVDSVNNVEVGNCQEKASDVEENDKIKENSNVAQKDNSSLDKIDAVKVSETCNILEKADNNEISSVQKNKPLQNHAQDETGMVLAEISQRSMDDVSQTSNVCEKTSIATGDNSQNSTSTVEEHDNLFEHKLLVSIKQESELMASEDLNKENAEEPQTTIKTEKDDNAEESSLLVESTTSKHDKKVTVKIETNSDTPIQSVEKQLVWEINPRDCESLKKEILDSEDNPAHESLIKEDEIMHDTSNRADKTLVWEIKSIISEPPVKEVPGNKERLPQHSLMKETSQDTVVDKHSQNAAKQIDVSVEMASEKQTECPPAKRAKVEPIWTTNVIDEDQPNVSQQKIKKPESDNVVLKKWFKAKGIAPGKEIFARLLEKSKLNKGVLRITNLYKTAGKEELMHTILKKHMDHIDSEIVEKIAHIHLIRSIKKAQAFIKWKKEDMLLVVKAYHLLSSCNTPNVFFDDRSAIDWDENDKPIGATKSTPGGQVTAPCIYFEFDEITTISGTRRPPPEPYITAGHINPIDPFNTYGLSKTFLNYFGLQAPLTCNVTASNLSKERSMDSILRIFSAVGTIHSYCVDTRVTLPKSMSLQIEYDHPLEAVQAMSMFHHQELDGRIIFVTKGFYNKNRMKKWYRNRGLQVVGSGLGPNETLLKNVRHTIELSKLKNTTANEIKQLKTQINDLKTKLASVDNMQNVIQNYALIKEKIASKTEQEAATVLTTAIANSIQSNLMSMLGIQSNQQSILPQNQNALIAVNSSAPNNASRTQAGKITTDSQKKAVSVAQNMPLPNMQTAANPSVLNMQQNAQGFINAPDQYAYMQGMQYCYPMATSTNLPGTLNIQPATCNVQPATQNKHSKPASQTSNRSTDLPVSSVSTSVYGIQKPATRFDIPPANIQPQKVVTPPNLSTASKTIKKRATRFDVAPTNVLPQKVEPATKSLETPPTQTQALVKTAFKNVNPIQPISAQAKTANIKINIPSLHPAQSTPKKRTLDTNKMKNALPGLPTKLPAYELQKEEAWISEKIKEIWSYNKSPDEIVRTPEKMGTTSDRKGLYTDTKGPPEKRIRKSPESIRTSPEIKIKVKQKSPKRLRKSPERFRKSTERLRKSPMRSKKSPEGRSPRYSQSPERSRKSPEKSRKSPRRFRKSPERSRKSASNDSWEIWGYNKSPDEIVRTPEKMGTPSDRKGLYTDTIGPPAKRIRKSPESIRRSPDMKIKVKQKSPKRFRESPERFRKSTERSRKSPIRSKKSPEKYSQSPERSRKSPEKSRKSPRRFRKSPERSRKSASNDSWDIEPSRSRSRKSPLRAAYEKPKDRSRSRERDSSNSKDRDRSKASFNKEREPERDNIMITKVYFTSLPASVTTADLQEQMSEIGPVSFAHAYGDSGQGVVEFRHRRDAETCIQMYNLAKVDGKTIEARWFK